MLFTFSGEARAGDLSYGDAQVSATVTIDANDILRIRQNAGGYTGVPLRGNADASGHDCRLAVSDALAIRQYMLGFRSNLPIFIPPKCWAFKLTATNGDGQEGVPYQTLPQPLEVTLENFPTCTRTISGCTLGGVTITYEIAGDSTGGALLSGGVTALDIVTTSSGTVSTLLTLGSGSGAVTIVVSVDLYSAEGGLLTTVSAIFTATAIGCSISSVGPATGCPGDSVTIDGSNFGVVQGTVEFDTTPATVTSWGNTSIKVDAPGGNYSNVTVTPTAAGPCSLAGAYSYDIVAVVSITSPVDGVTITAGNVPVSGTADLDIANVTVTTDQGLTGEPYSSPVDGGGNWSVTLTGVNEPSLTITAQGTDNCGNAGSDSISVPVRLPLCMWNQSNWDRCRLGN